MSGSGSKSETRKDRVGGGLLTASPRYSATALGSGLLFEQYVSSGIMEVPEGLNTSHVLILRSGSPTLIEWRSGGRDHRARLGAESVSVLPAGVAARRCVHPEDQPAVFRAGCQ
jgi:hypothetical protein